MCTAPDRLHSVSALFRCRAQTIHITIFFFNESKRQWIEQQKTIYNCICNDKWTVIIMNCAKCTWNDLIIIIKCTQLIKSFVKLTLYLYRKLNKKWERTKSKRQMRQVEMATRATKTATMAMTIKANKLARARERKIKC